MGMTKGDRQKVMHKRWLLAHPEQVRAAKRASYWRNRKRILAKRRASWKTRRKPEPAEILRRCRRHPPLARRILGPDRVLCLMCGRGFGQLASHLSRVHRITGGKYLRRWPHAPLISVHRGITVQKARSKRIPPWPLAVARVAGKTSKEIQKEHGWKTMTAVTKRLRPLGFDIRKRGGSVFSLGRLVDSAFIRDLKERINRPVSRLTAWLGASPLAIHISLRPQRPTLAMARKWKLLPKQILAAARKIDFRRDPDLYPCSRPSLLYTLQPNLRPTYAILLLSLRRLRRFLRQNPNCSTAEVGEYLCDGAQAEVALGSPDGAATIFMRLAAQAQDEGFLDLELGALRETLRGRGRARGIPAIAYDWLARLVGVECRTLTHRTEVVPPPIMGRLMEKVSPKRRRGRQPGPDKTTKARITVAADLSDRGVTKYGMCSDLYPQQQRKEHAYASVKMLFGSFKDDIQTELQRLRTLPEAERKKQVEAAAHTLKA